MTDTPHAAVQTLLDALNIHREVKDFRGVNVPALILRERERLESVECLLPNPARIRRCVQHRTFASFLDYLKFWQMESGTVVFIGQNKMTAIIDGHQVDQPEWGDHKSVFHYPKSESFSRWSECVSTTGTKLSQSDLALLFERRAADVVTPDAATMQEIAATLEANTKVSFKSGVRLQNGDRQFIFEHQTEALAGTKGTLEIPEQFRIRTTLWEGAMPVEMDVKMRYRIADGNLIFILEWAGLADAEDETRVAAYDEIRSACPNVEIYQAEVS